MSAHGHHQRGYTLVEVMIVVAFATTLMAIAVPVMTNVSDSSKLTEATREVERELATARLRAVQLNRLLRVRLNCPAAGYLRTVEVVGTSVDTAADRCLESAYPYPAADTDLMTRPNYDGPMRVLPRGATVTNDIIEFTPEGTAFQVLNGTPQNIVTPVTITVTRGGHSRTVTVNGVGKVQLQQQ
jgi:prepilin-type N-terminal cleavage/methylation domain-containing protein